MKKEKFIEKGEGYMVTLFFLYIFILAIWFIGIEEEVVGEVPCVDGRNRINLEGIMCENSEITFFGENSNFVFLLMIPLLLIGYVLVKGVLNMGR